MKANVGIVGHGSAENSKSKLLIPIISLKQETSKFLEVFNLKNSEDLYTI